MEDWTNTPTEDLEDMIGICRAFKWDISKIPDLDGAIEELRERKLNLLGI
jgi:alpha-glucosidase (family GH31 glycosyl hydrolase)